MNRVMFNRLDEPYYKVIHTVIIQPPDCCDQCAGRIECLILEKVYTCHLKVEWFVPKVSNWEPTRIFVWRNFHVPSGMTRDGTPTWVTDNNNGNPVEKYATHLDENFKRLTGLTLAEFEEKLRT